jgi:phenylacetate-coenzyme A ligase PaaK-like adenylate-forming protein
MLGGLLAMTARMRELKRLENLTRAELEEIKLGKFRRLVAWAVERSPYYADIVRERGIDAATCTVEDFPVLTKSTLMANFDRIVTDRRITKQVVSDFLSRSHDPQDKLFGQYRVIHTSGTSGEVGYFLFNSSDWVRGLLPARPQRRGTGGPRGRRARLAFYGATDGHYAGVTVATALGSGFLKLLMDVRTFEINRPLAETIAALEEFRPDALSGYTNALKVLAEKRRDGALKIAPTAISAAGETMTKADAAVIEEGFGVAPTSGYGSSEHLFMGASNPDGETMTLYDSELIYEPFEDHCLVTNLFNTTEPLIRYRMSDILRPVPHEGPAPLWLVISTLIGRTELTPTFVNRDGATDFISPHTINEIFVPGVARFQLRLTGERSFRFLAVLSGSLDAAARGAAVAGLEARLREILAAKKLDHVVFKVETVDDIPPDPRTRKFRLIVDERAGAPASAGVV